MRFEVFTKEIEIDGDTYEIRPLTGRFLPKLYAVSSKLGQVDEDADEKEFLKALDEDLVSKIQELAVETFKKSYPREDEEKLEQWVGQNLMSLIPPIVEVNLNTDSDELKE